MNEFIECRDCGFVTFAADTTEPKPEKWESCPSCGGSAFRFSSESEPATDD